MTAPPTRRPGPALRWLALATALGAWELVSIGGMVRVSESGLGCPDWPLCSGRVVPGAAKEPVIEYAHRASAAVVVALLLATVVVALLRERRRTAVVLPFALALALVPVQALLGAIVVWLELPGRLVGVHFMIGLTMLALATYGAVAAWRGDTVVSATFATTTLATGAVALLLVSLGASVVATDGMHACGQEWPSCNGGLADGGGLAVLQVLHRTAAYGLSALAVVLLVLGLRGHAPLRAALPLVCLCGVQLLLGIAIVLSTHGTVAHDLVRALHVAVAGAVWACAVALVALVTTDPVGARAAVAATGGRTRSGAALPVEGARP